MEELVSSDDERRWYEDGQQALAFDKKWSWVIRDDFEIVRSSTSHDLSLIADELRLKPTGELGHDRSIEIHESVLAPSSAAQLATYARLVADPANQIPALYITLGDLALASAPPRSVLSKLRQKCMEFEDRWNDHFIYPLSVQKHKLAHVKSLTFSMRGTLYDASLVFSTCKRIASVFPCLALLEMGFPVEDLPVEKIYTPPRLRTGRVYQKLAEVIAMAPKLEVLLIRCFGHDKLYPHSRMDRRTRDVVKKSFPMTLQIVSLKGFYAFAEPFKEAVQERRLPLWRHGIPTTHSGYQLYMLNAHVTWGVETCLRLYRISLYHAKLMDCGLVSSQRQGVQARDRYMDILKRLSYSGSIEEAGVDKSWRELEAECRQAEQKLSGTQVLPKSTSDQHALCWSVNDWTNAIRRMTALLLSEIPEHLRFID